MVLMRITRMCPHCGTSSIGEVGAHGGTDAELAEGFGLPVWLAAFQAETMRGDAWYEMVVTTGTWCSGEREEVLDDGSLNDEVRSERHLASIWDLVCSKSSMMRVPCTEVEARMKTASDELWEVCTRDWRAQSKGSGHGGGVQGAPCGLAPGSVQRPHCACT
jgi:hypothetical protein